MMNEYIYRAKDIDTGVWIYGYVVLEESLCLTPESVQRFKYDRERDEYFEIDMPDGESSLISFVLG